MRIYVVPPTMIIAAANKQLLKDLLEVKPQITLENLLSFAFAFVS